MGCFPSQSPDPKYMLEIGILNTELSKKNQQIEKLTSKMKVLQSTPSSAPPVKNSNTSAEMDRLNEDMNTLKRDRATLASQLETLTKELQLSKDKESQLANNYETEKNNLKKQYESEQANLQKEKTQFTIKEETARNQIRILENQLAQLAQEKYQLKLQVQEFEKLKNQPKIEKSKENQVNISKEDAIKIHEQQIQIHDLTQQLQHIKSTKKVEEKDSFFPGVILEDCQEYKTFLFEIIESRVGLDIAKTKQIYKYDPLNKTNFHLYIDNKENLVVVIKAASGEVFGGWSEGPFYPKMTSDRNGIIFSLTNRKCYDLAQHNKKAISYDDYYIIFGNSEIRLRSQQNLVFSNFGINNSFYNHKGDRVSSLLGTQKREIQIQGYEIFQLFFN